MHIYIDRHGILRLGSALCTCLRFFACMCRCISYPTTPTGNRPQPGKSARIYSEVKLAVLSCLVLRRLPGAAPRVV